MGKFKIISLALITGLSLSACSSSNAEANASSDNVKTQHKHMDVEQSDSGQPVDDLQKVDFMDENFDMDEIEHHDCCDE